MNDEKKDIWAETKVDEDERHLLTAAEQAEAWRDMKFAVLLIILVTMAFVLKMDGFDLI